MQDVLPDLKKAMYDAVSEAVPEDEVAVAFSGGVDSSLLAKICEDLGKMVTLVTTGFPGSHDIRFSKSIAAKMGIKHEVAEINYDSFEGDLGRVRRAVMCENTSHIENCIAYYYVSQLAEKNCLRIVLSANGCDELFCGYNGYRMVYSAGEEAMMKFMEDKIANELALVQEIATVASQFGVSVRQPFLSSKFIKLARSIPICKKIMGPDDMLRKHVLRDVALEIGVPQESATKPKKALQYGSLVHKYFKKIRSQS